MTADVSVAIATDRGRIEVTCPGETPAAELAAELAGRVAAPGDGVAGLARLHNLVGEPLDPDVGLVHQTQPGQLLVLRASAHGAAPVDDAASLVAEFGGEFGAEVGAEVGGIDGAAVGAGLAVAVSAISATVAALAWSDPARAAVLLGGGAVLLLVGLVLSGVTLARVEQSAAVLRWGALYVAGAWAATAGALLAPPGRWGVGAVVGGLGVVAFAATSLVKQVWGLVPVVGALAPIALLTVAGVAPVAGVPPALRGGAVPPGVVGVCSLIAVVVGLIATCRRPPGTAALERLAAHPPVEREQLRAAHRELLVRLRLAVVAWGLCAAGCALAAARLPWGWVAGLAVAVTFGSRSLGVRDRSTRACLGGAGLMVALVCVTAHLAGWATARARWGEALVVLVALGFFGAVSAPGWLSRSAWLARYPALCAAAAVAAVPVACAGALVAAYDGGWLGG